MSAVVQVPADPGREKAGRRRAKRHRGRGRPCLDSRYREPFLDAMGEFPRDPGERCVGWHRAALRGGAPRRALWPSRSRSGFRDERNAPAVRSVARGHRREIENAPSRVADRLQTTRFGGARDVQLLQQRPSWPSGSQSKRRDGCWGVKVTTDRRDHRCPRGQLVRAEMFGARPVYRQRKPLPPGRPGHSSNLGRGHHIGPPSGALS